MYFFRHFLHFFDCDDLFGLLVEGLVDHCERPFVDALEQFKFSDCTR